MNKQRRKALDAVLVKLEEAKSDLDALREEEQEYYDNMPQSIQDGEKGEAAQAAIDALDAVDSNLEEACDYLRESVT